MELIEEQLCTCCGEVKPIAMFNKDKKSKTGYTYKCKQCCKEYKRKYYEENTEKLITKSCNYYHENVELVAERAKEFRENNKEKIAEDKAKYYWEHREERLSYNREYYLRNAESIKELTKQYRETPRGNAIKKNAEHKRRAQKRNCEHPATAEEIQLLKDTSSHCFYCSCELEGDAHIDHFQPLALGGEHAIENLVMACPTCNMSKGAKDPYSWALAKFSITEDQLKQKLKDNHGIR